MLALMAEGRSNPAIARSLVITDKAIEKHIGNIFTKLDLAPARKTTDECWPSCAGSPSDGVATNGAFLE